MRRTTLTFLAALAAAGCAPDRRPTPEAEPTEAPVPEADAPPGGSGPAPVLIGVVIGAGLLLILLSNSAFIPSTDQ